MMVVLGVVVVLVVEEGVVGFVVDFGPEWLGLLLSFLSAQISFGTQFLLECDVVPWLCLSNKTD